MSCMEYQIPHFGVDRSKPAEPQPVIIDVEFTELPRTSGAGAAIIGLPATTGEVSSETLPGAVSDGGAGRFFSETQNRG